MNYSKRHLLIVGSYLMLGLGSVAVFGGCGSSEPVVTEAAKKLEEEQMKTQTEANDAAAKAASQPSRPKAGVMPP